MASSIWTRRCSATCRRSSGKVKERVTVRMLLAHASGLPAWRPLFREAQTDAEAFAARRSETPLESAPGARDVYSDLGIDRPDPGCGDASTDERLDSLLERRVFSRSA